MTLTKWPCTQIDIDMVTMYLHVHNEARRSSSLKVVVLTNTQTDTQADITENITYLHTWMETLKKYQGAMRCHWEFFHFCPTSLSCARFLFPWNLPEVSYPWWLEVTDDPSPNSCDYQLPPLPTFKENSKACYGNKMTCQERKRPQNKCFLKCSILVTTQFKWCLE